MKYLFLSFLSLLITSCIYAQNAHSIHSTQLEYYNSLPNSDAAHYDSIVKPSSCDYYEKSGCQLNKVVYGWHPFWVGSVYQNYNWDLLSHFSFFSYEVNPTDGEPITTHGWSTSAAVGAALASGNTKVTLTVTLFSNHSTFFSSLTAQQTLITNLINLVQLRGAQGVNIDFEGLPSSYKTEFANFMVDLCNQMHTAIPGSEISTVLYAVDWNNVFDFSIMEPAVDHYIIMGYAYYYQGSSSTGPCDPLYHFGSSYNYTLSKTITYYLNKGCPKQKLIMGLPYYGYQWPTSSSTIPSSTTGSGVAKTYRQIKNNSSGHYSAANHFFDLESYTDVYTFNNGGNYQCFITEESGFRKRLEHINTADIGGIGIWALGYDDGYNDFWYAIDDYLTDCYTDSCTNEIHDFGGPLKDYYNNEDYTWTIAPDSASALTFDFTFFDVEQNWDYLYIFDGNSVNAPQISGSPFTGSIGPGIFTSSTGAVTFRFYSDAATVSPGFTATYDCTINQPTEISQHNTNEFSVFPNPASTFISFSTEDVASNFDLFIVDLYGKVVWRETAQNNTKLDISSLASGYYFFGVGSMNNNKRMIPFVKD